MASVSGTRSDPACPVEESMRENRSERPSGSPTEGKGDPRDCPSRELVGSAAEGQWKVPDAASRGRGQLRSVSFEKPREGSDTANGMVGRTTLEGSVAEVGEAAGMIGVGEEQGGVGGRTEWKRPVAAPQSLSTSEM